MNTKHHHHHDDFDLTSVTPLGFHGIARKSSNQAFIKPLNHDTRLLFQCLTGLGLYAGGFFAIAWSNLMNHNHYLLGIGMLLSAIGMTLFFFNRHKQSLPKRSTALRLIKITPRKLSRQAIARNDAKPSLFTKPTPGFFSLHIKM